MPPQAVSLALFIIEEGIKLEPELANAVRSLLSKNDPSPQDWADLRTTVMAKSYRDYVPATALPPEPSTSAPATGSVSQ